MKFQYNRKKWFCLYYWTLPISLSIKIIIYLGDIFKINFRWFKFFTKRFVFLKIKKNHLFGCIKNKIIYTHMYRFLKLQCKWNLFETGALSVQMFWLTNVCLRVRHDLTVHFFWIYSWSRSYINGNISRNNSNLLFRHGLCITWKILRYNTNLWFKHGSNNI